MESKNDKTLLYHEVSDQIRHGKQQDLSEYFCLVAEGEIPYAISSHLELVDGYGNMLCL